MQTVEQTKQLSQGLALTPIVEVLDQVGPTSASKEVSPSVKESLDGMFPEQEYIDKKVQRAKAILGDLVKDFSEAELRDVVTEIQFLVDSWLDDYEREVFDGLTLRELLHERGGK